MYKINNKHNKSRAWKYNIAVYVLYQIKSNRNETSLYKKRILFRTLLSRDV